MTNLDLDRLLDFVCDGKCMIPSEKWDKFWELKNPIKSKLEKFEKYGWMLDYANDPDMIVYERKQLEQQVKELQEENRQLKFRLADEQDCNQHGECHQIIQDLKEQRDFLQNDLVDKKQKLEKIEGIDINWLYLFGVLRLHETESPMKKIVEELDDLKSILENK